MVLDKITEVASDGLLNMQELAMSTFLILKDQAKETEVPFQSILKFLIAVLLHLYQREENCCKGNVQSLEMLIIQKEMNTRIDD